MTPRRAFRLPSSRARLDADVDDELRFHIEGRIEELMTRDGLSRAAAEAEARRLFGDVAAYTRETRDIDRETYFRRGIMEMLDDARRETRTAWRTLRRAPTFSLIALATLAIGLGATTAIFTLLDRIAIRPLPYANAERLVHLGTAWPGVAAGEEYGLSRYIYHRFIATSRTLESLGLYQNDVYALPGGNGLDAERVAGIDASVGLLRLLGIKPEIGRLYTEEEQLPKSPDVILISHGLWQRRFGGDRTIVGRSIDVGGRMMQVIGVLPASARVPQVEAEIWEPLHLDPAEAPQNHHTFNAIGVMRPGTTVQQMDAELRGILRGIIADYPNVYPAGFMARTGFALVTRTMRDEIVGPRVARALWILFGSVAIVLLIAAANVANLFLVRLDARRREVAVRTALGAGRAQLASHFLAESLLLSAGAAILALALAWSMLRFGVRVAPESLPRLDEVALDWRGIAFCVTAALLAGLAFGALPLVRTRIDVAMLREGGRGLTSSRARNAARRTLVVAQVALAVVLLAGAGLMIKSFERLRSVRPGFDANDVVTMAITLRGDRYRSDAQLVQFWRTLSERVAALPNVTDVGAISALPLGGGSGCTAVHAHGSSLDPSLTSQCVPVITVAPGYFRGLRIPVRGHAPDWADEQGAAGRMVISRALANKFWPGEDPIGKTLTVSPRRALTYVISGVAEDVRADGLQKPPIEAAYFPIASPATAPALPNSDMEGNFLHLVIRAPNADLQRVASAVQHVLTDIDRQVPVADIEPMNVLVRRSVAQVSFTMLLLAMSAGIAIVLSAVGIYGVISYLVAQRHAEIGIRVALGAPLRGIGRMVVAQSVRMALVGALLGTVAAVAGTRLLGALLFEVSPTDPLVLGVVPALLVAIAAAAAFAPARRAARVDPVEAIRGA